MRYIQNIKHIFIKLEIYRIFRRAVLCIFYIALILSIPDYSSAQNTKKSIDSLKRLLIKSKEDTFRVNLLGKLSQAYDLYNPDSGIFYGNEGLKLAEQLNYETGKGRLYIELAKNYVNKNDSKTAIEFFNKALSKYKSSKLDRANICRNIGRVYNATGDFDSALINEKIALDIFNEMKDDDNIAYTKSEIGELFDAKGNYDSALNSYFNAAKIFDDKKNILWSGITDKQIGVVCYKQGNYKKAKEYFINAQLKIEELSKKDSGVVNTEQLAMIYVNIANLYKDQKSDDSALYFYKKALAIFKSISREDGIAANLLNIGDVYSNQKQYDNALDNYFSGLKLAQALGSKEYLSIFWGNIGIAYLKIYRDTFQEAGTNIYISKNRNQNLLKAIEYLNKGLITSKETGAREGVRECSQYLAEAYKFAGDYKSALENYIQYSVVKDSLSSLEGKKSLTKYETQKQKELADKQIEVNVAKAKLKQNETWGLYVGICVLMVVIGLVVRSNMKQNKSNKIITREKKRSDELLLNILPAEVAEELKDKGSADAKFFEEVTVFFSDFVGFTKVSERMTPQELVNELDACFKGFDYIMSKYNIEKIKTVGDAYLAVSGLPMGDPNHAEKIIKAAIEIRNFQLDRKARLGEKTFEVRIGAHTGSVVAGIVGVKKFAYDIWGDTVNTAARMEQNSQPGKINISESTYNIIKDKFECTYRGKIQAKNKGELSMYFVEGFIQEEAEV